MTTANPARQPWNDASDVRVLPERLAGIERRLSAPPPPTVIGDYMLGQDGKGRLVATNLRNRQVYVLVDPATMTGTPLPS